MLRAKHQPVGHRRAGGPKWVIAFDPQPPIVLAPFLRLVPMRCLPLSFPLSVSPQPDKTVIVSPPQDLKVQVGKTAIFTCLSVVDPKLGTAQIQWRKNDQKLFESYADEK